MVIIKKISQFLSELFKILFLLPWYLCFGFSFVAVGLMFFALMVEWWLNLPPLSLLFKENENYGDICSGSYTKRETKNIYDVKGNKVGSYEGKGEVVSYEYTDNQKYKPRYFWMYLYMLYFPFQRIFMIFISFIAIFTNKFYISVKIPADCETPHKYNRVLYTLFNVIYERSNVEIQECKEKDKKKKTEKEEKRIKKERFFYNLKTTYKEPILFGVKIAIILLVILIVLLIVL